MAGQGRIYVNETREVGDIRLTHQYEVDLRFDIGFDYGGYNNNAKPWSMSCDGQNRSGSSTFNIPSGNGTYQWGNIGGTQTFTITMPGSGQSKTIGFSATIDTGVNPATISANGSHSLAAVVWEHTVSYNANGGSGAPGSQTKVYGTVLTLSSTKPTRSGYSFTGWNTKSDGTGTEYSASGDYGADVDVTLYAQWNKTITLTYNANGGSGAPSSESGTIHNSTTSYSFIVSSTKPTRTGYLFLGWGTQATATTATYTGGQTLDLSNSTTLYAIWEARTLTVNYYSNYASTYNGTNTALNTVNNNNVQIYTSVYSYDTSYSYGLLNYSASGSSLYMTRSGYTATGYWGTSTSGGKLVSQDTSFDSGQALATALGVDISSSGTSINVYAQWEPANVAYYKSNGKYVLCNTYGKVNGAWQPMLFYGKIDGVWKRSVVDE